MPRSRSASRPFVVLLVRHGQTPTTGKVLPGRAKGLHLSDSGRAQAQAVAERLSSRRIDAVYCSPLERARETAAPIAAALGTKAVVERGLLELDIGDWTGTALKDARRERSWKVVQQHPSGFRFPGGESFVEMQTRMTTTLARLGTAHPGGTVVAVSHADPIKAAAIDAMGAHLDFFQRIVISPCSVTAIAYGELAPVVLTLNSTGGLADLRPS